MGPSPRQTFAHLEQIQNQTDRGQRRKKRKRDYRKMWIDADKAFYEAHESLGITKHVAALLQHPELKAALSKEQLSQVSAKAREVAQQTKAQVKKLTAIRDTHILTRAKYPRTQRRFAPTDEVIDNMTVLEAYATWTEETMKLVILPCAEISELVEDAGLSVTPEETEESENND